MKVMLGTAQFGLDYGVTNATGKVDFQEALSIIETLKEGGLEGVDTAPLYGHSEQVLGELLLSYHNLEVITKTCKFEKAAPFPLKVLLQETFMQSLKRLNKSHVKGLLIHRVQDLESFPSLWGEMQQLRNAGLVKKIGASLYSPSDLEIIFKYPDIDIVQLPLNVFDQRFLADGSLQEIKNRGIEVHVRSIFLQGILLQQTPPLSSQFIPAQHVFLDYFENLSQRGLTPMEGAVSFIKSLNSLVDAVVVGFVNRRQATEFCQAFNKPISAVDFSRYAIKDEKIVNPMWWPAKNVFWKEQQ